MMKALLCDDRWCLSNAIGREAERYLEQSILNATPDTLLEAESVDFVNGVRLLQAVHFVCAIMFHIAYSLYICCG